MGGREGEGGGVGGRERRVEGKREEEREGGRVSEEEGCREMGVRKDIGRWGKGGSKDRSRSVTTVDYPHSTTDLFNGLHSIFNLMNATLKIKYIKYCHFTAAIYEVQYMRGLT